MCSILFDAYCVLTSALEGQGCFLCSLLVKNILAKILNYWYSTIYYPFEQDEYGNHRIVTVRTQGTSDDNNHDKIDAKSVYMKISSDTRTIASYYSLDKKEWHMVRLYRNEYPDQIYLGISSQCPQHGGCTSIIEDITLSHDNVGDFRMG